MMRLSGSVKLRCDLGSGWSGGRQHASDLGFQFRLAFLHALITHRFMLRCVRFDLRAIKRDMAEFDQPCRLASTRLLSPLPRLVKKSPEQSGLFLCLVSCKDTGGGASKA